MSKTGLTRNDGMLVWGDDWWETQVLYSTISGCHSSRVVVDLFSISLHIYIYIILIILQIHYNCRGWNWWTSIAWAVFLLAQSTHICTHVLYSTISGCHMYSRFVQYYIRVPYVLGCPIFWLFSLIIVLIKPVHPWYVLRPQKKFSSKSVNVWPTPPPPYRHLCGGSSGGELRNRF